MPVILLRHGETEWSASGRHTGRTDIPLTEVGRHEAKLLGEAVRDRPPDLVLTSPLGRARHTAALAGLVAEVEPDLAEWDYGPYEGLTTPDIRTQVPGWTVWTHPVPGGETLDEVAARADRVLARIAPLAGDSTIVLVGHGHQLRVLAARWVRQSGAFGQRLVLGTASMSLLGHEHGEPAILAWNDRHHLAGR
jgi:broad specificity phosphatase PhoE